MEKLYHYCSAQSFHSIITSKRLRLSLMSLSNDSLEGKVVAQTFARLADKNNLDPTSRESLISRVSNFSDVFEGLGFCLSEDRDLLSQWRGYADGAKGFAIGFSKDYLEILVDSYRETNVPQVSLEQVRYDLSEHETEIEAVYRDLIARGKTDHPWSALLIKNQTPQPKDLVETNKRWAVPDFSLLAVLPSLFRLKTPAFSEEKEWRLISLFVPQSDLELGYRPSSDTIIPFREIELRKVHAPPLVEIVLGPKNRTPTWVVEKLLAQVGFNRVPINRSAASYR